MFRFFFLKYFKKKKGKRPTYAYLTKVAGNLGLEFKLAIAK
jgi:hypothetical protein